MNGFGGESQKALIITALIYELRLRARAHNDGDSLTPSGNWLSDAPRRLIIRWADPVAAHNIAFINAPRRK